MPGHSSPLDKYKLKLSALDYYRNYAQTGYSIGRENKNF